MENEVKERWIDTRRGVPGIGQVVVAWWDPVTAASAPYCGGGEWGPPGDPGVRYLKAPLAWTVRLNIEVVPPVGPVRPAA